MRTLTTQESTIYSRGRPSPRTRVSILDAGGTWRDLTALTGRDWVFGVELEENIDQPVATCTVTLAREAFSDSLSPLRTDARANLLSGSFSALVQAGREFKVEVAIMPDERLSPVSTDWREVFHGDIDEPDFGQDPFQFTARDLGGRLQDLWIETDTRQYGSSGGSTAESVIQAIINESHTNGPATVDGTPANANCYWAAGYAYSLRDRRLPTAPNGYVYQVTVAGTSSGSQPTWPTTIGATVNDGGVTWKCLRAIPQLYTPTPSTFLVKTYQQKSQSVMDAIRAIAALLGWDLRYFWINGGWNLTFQQPPRGSSTSLYTFDADHYYDVKKLSVSRQDIRNKIQVTYTDTSNLDTAGLPSRAHVIVEDGPSQDTYSGGLPRFCEIAEAGTSQINTASQATTMANAILSDLKDPVAQQSIELPFFYAGQLFDIYTFKANGRHYSSNQVWAVTRVAHRLDQNTARTTIDTRGKPAGAVTDWLRMEARPGSALSAAFSAPPQPAAPTVTKVPNGVAVVHTPPWIAGKQWDASELHVSTSSGFTPSSATLRAFSRTGRFEVADLIAGSGYYGKIVPRDSRGNRGQSSAQFSLNAGYVNPYQMQPQVHYNFLPNNPSFEGSNIAGSPPDNWSVSAGTWGTDMIIDTGQAQTGAQSVKWPSGGSVGNTSLRSDLFVGIPNRRYAFSFFFQTNGATGGSPAPMQGFVTWYSDAGVTSVGGISINVAAFSAGAWTRQFAVATAPVGTKYGRITLNKTPAGSSTAFDLWVDSVALELQQNDAESWIAMSLGSGWVAYGSPKQAPSYYQDAAGMVHLGGQAKNGTIGAVMATLAAGYRPAFDRDFVVYAPGGPDVVTVGSTGSITINGSINSQVSLDGISFRAEQ